MPHDANKDGRGGGGGGEEDEGTAAEQKGGEVEPDGGSDRAAAGKDPHLQFQTYKDAARRFYLQLSDNNMVGAH